VYISTKNDKTKRHKVSLTPNESKVDWGQERRVEWDLKLARAAGLVLEKTVMFCSETPHLSISSWRISYSQFHASSFN
jgi:hypothetical protein